MPKEDPNMVPTPTEDVHHSSVGSRIKQLRKKKNISLQTLSRLSGVSAGMLSQVERDLANPSLRLLTKIQVGLGTTAGTLFPSDNAEPPVAAAQSSFFVQRKGERPICELDFLTKELLSDGAGQMLELMMLQIPPKGSSGPTPMISLAEKGGLVLEGSLTINIDGAEANLLEGDSFTFDGRRPHSFRNISDAPARILWVIGNFPIEHHL